MDVSLYFTAIDSHFVMGMSIDEQRMKPDLPISFLFVTASGFIKKVEAETSEINKNKELRWQQKKIMTKNKNC